MKRWLIFFFALLSLSAWAQDVTVGGQVLMRVDSNASAAAIEARLEELLVKGADAKDLRLQKTPGGVGIYWGKTLVVMVTKALAEANNSNPEALARMWLERLRELAETGYLRIRPARVEMPIGTETSLDVTGVATGPFFFDEPTGRVQLFEEADGKLRLVAKAVGKTKVIVQRGKARVSLIVHVKDWAGYPPEQVTLKVTGNPAPSEMVLDGAIRALRSQSRVNPGCSLILAREPEPVPSIPPGETLRFKIPIRIEGNEDYYPVSKELPVLVQSVKLDSVESNLLLVSNRPEQVDQDGVLMDYTLSKTEPSRLMYSHMNASRDPRNLWVNLVNPTAEPVEVLVDWTFAGPSVKEIQVGHMAAGRFLSRLQQNAGYVLSIPARTSLELASHRLGHKELLSGFANLRLLSGEKLQVQVLSRLAPGRNDGSKLPNLGAPFNPFKIHPHGVFAQPFFEEWLEYAAGQPPLTMNYGESPWLIDFETGLPNTGNFGVIYRWHVTVTNPTNRPTRVGLSLTPQNGAAAGTVWINGLLYQTPFGGRGNEQPVATFDLRPRQELTLDVVTFPEASSSYPVTLSVREIRSGEAFQPPPPVGQQL